MPLLDPARLARLTGTIPAHTQVMAPRIGSIAPLSRAPSSTASRSFSASPLRSSSDSHGSHYDPPSGWLFGIPPGEKYKKEGWEGVWVYGFFGSLGLAVVAYAFKPDSSIQTWALEEARRRLEAEGILPDPEVGQK